MSTRFSPIVIATALAFGMAGCAVPSARDTGPQTATAGNGIVAATNAYGLAETVEPLGQNIASKRPILFRHGERLGPDLKATWQ